MLSVNCIWFAFSTTKSSMADICSSVEPQSKYFCEIKIFKKKTDFTTCRVYIHRKNKINKKKFALKKKNLIPLKFDRSLHCQKIPLINWMTLLIIITYCSFSRRHHPERVDHKSIGESFLNIGKNSPFSFIRNLSFVPNNKKSESAHGVAANAPDCDIIVNEFKFQSSIYVHFRINNLGKSLILFIAPAIC